METRWGGHSAPLAAPHPSPSFSRPTAPSVLPRPSLPTPTGIAALRRTRSISEAAASVQTRRPTRHARRLRCRNTPSPAMDRRIPDRSNHHKLFRHVRAPCLLARRDIVPARRSRAEPRRVTVEAPPAGGILVRG